MNKTSSIVTVITFCVILFGLAIAFFAIPDKVFSEQENRTLQEAPKLTAEDFFSGRFADGVNDWYADQFPMRDAFVGAKGIAETVLLKGENNGVLAGKNGQLATYRFTAYENMTNIVSDTDGYFESHIVKSAEAVKALQKKLEEKDIPLCTIIAPRTLDVASSAFDYPDDGSTALRKLIRESLTDELNIPDVISDLKDLYDSGEYVTYKTDHHWTTLGAYYVYRDYCLSNGLIPLEKSDFIVQTTENFYGTVWSKAGLKYIEPDTLEIWLYGNESEFTVTDPDTGESFTGFYNFDYLETKDKYATFLDGTHSKLIIRKNTDAKRETLLVAKDSFANSVIPFLAQHYDIVVLNLSGYGDETDISKYAEEYGADRVLILYGLENIVGNARMSKIK